MRIASSLVFLAFLMPVVAFPQAPQPLNVVIEGGRIVDGTGNPWYLADIGIRDGVIARIGDLSGSARGYFDTHLNSGFNHRRASRLFPYHGIPGGNSALS